MKTLLLVAFACAATSVLAQQPPQYDLRFYGANTSAFAINSFGDAVGWVPQGGNTRAWVAIKGKPLEILPIPIGYLSSGAYDINDSGVIVGNVSPQSHASLSTVAAIWRKVNGRYQIELRSGLPGQPFSAAFAINNLGDIIGGSGYTGYGSMWRNAVLFTPSGTQPILDWMSVSDINDQRVVVSDTLQLDLDTMQVHNVGLPAGVWQGITTSDINDRNEMVGRLMSYSSSLSNFPVRYTAATGWTIVGSASNNAGASALNNRGDFLTYVESGACRVNLRGVGEFNPSQLLDPSQGLWYVMWYGASDINDARQMLISVKDSTLTMTGAALITPRRAENGSK